MTAEIRRLGPGDLAQLRALNVLFAEVFGEEDTYLGQPPDDAYCRDLLARDEIILLVALDEGRIIGGIGAYLLRKFERARSEIYIYDLAVAQDRRREGVATALIEETRRIARAKGAWMIFVQADTQPEDEPAVALYRTFATGEEEALHFDIAP